MSRRLLPIVTFGCWAAACAPRTDVEPPVGSSATLATSASGPNTAHAATPGAAPSPASAFSEIRIFDFVPEVAEIVATVLDAKRQRVGVIIALQDRNAGRCGDTTTRSMQFQLPDWRPGLKVEFDALARSDPSRGYADNAASAKTWVMKLERTPELSADSRIHPEIPWDPKGTIEVLDPASGSVADNVRVRLRNGSFKFEGVVPVRVCVPVD